MTRLFRHCRAVVSGERHESPQSDFWLVACRLGKDGPEGVPLVEKVLGRLPSKEDIEVVDFATDADLAILRQEPLRARVLLRAIGIVFSFRRMGSFGAIG